MENQPYKSFYRCFNFELATKCSFSHAYDKLMVGIDFESHKKSMVLDIKIEYLEETLNEKLKTKIK